MEKARGFLKVLADNNAVCALQYRDTMVRFGDVGQVRTSLARLAADNLKELPATLRGEFVAALPFSHTFEFLVAENQQVIKGKVPRSLPVEADINDHLHQAVTIQVMTTQVGSGRVRYVLMAAPVWESVP